MAFLILLLSSCLFIGATANFNESTALNWKILIDHHLLSFITPKHYDIQLTPQISANVLKFFGNISTEIKILHPTQIIKLHALQSYVDAKQFVLTKNKTDELIKDDQPKMIYYPSKYEYGYEAQVLILYFDTKILEGTYILKMKFESIMDNDKEKGSFLHKTFHINKNGYKM